MHITTNIWYWFTAICILGMWTFLYKENPIFRVAEHVFVGSTAGHAIGMAIGNIYRYGWNPLVQKTQLLLLVPIALGILLYARFLPRIAWLSRWPVAFLVGVGTGQSIYTALRTQVINQSIGAMVKLPGATLGVTLNGLISTVGLLAVLTYFVFSIPQSGPVKGFAKTGRWLMMVTFGVSFGNVVAGRISVLLGELSKLLGDWLGML